MKVVALMASVFELLNDERICEKICQRLPYLFALAELEASRAGRVGMEIGTLREQILIALLIYKFGEEEVFDRLGRENYLHIPKRGTNPRGVEISRKAIARLITHPQTKGLAIKWHRPTADLKEGER